MKQDSPRSIFAVDLWLSRTVQTQTLGVTDMVFAYAIGESIEALEPAVRAWWAANNAGAEIHKLQLRPAVQQDLRRYTFPEQIIGISTDELAFALEGRYQYA